MNSGATIAGDVQITMKESLIKEQSSSSTKDSIFFSCFKKEVDPDQPWKLDIRRNETIENTIGLSNKISTTKYTMLSWLPSSVFMQFRRIANVYFLVISIMMLIGNYFKELYETPLNPWTTLGTLLFVLLVTSIKEGIEDLSRNKQDRAENTRLVNVVTFDGDKEVIVQKQNQEVKAGDIIKMEGRTNVPADLILLLTSNYADGNQCYVETANIDGETNLKVREAPAAIIKMLGQEDRIVFDQATNAAIGVSLNEKILEGGLEFEPPNKNIHNFIGALTLNAVKDGAISLSPENLLLRSSLFSTFRCHR